MPVVREKTEADGHIFLKKYEQSDILFPVWFLKKEKGPTF
jgi:hypothetical protein